MCPDVNPVNSLKSPSSICVAPNEEMCELESVKSITDPSLLFSWKWGACFVALWLLSLSGSKWDYITLNLAAQMGDVTDQYELAEMYSGDSKYAKAIKWYHKAADQGHAMAQHKLGYISHWSRCSLGFN
jgi:hypothetical protein